MADETPSEDTEPTPTVRSRAASIPIPEERLLEQIERGVLMLDGESVTDLDTPPRAGRGFRSPGSSRDAGRRSWA